MTDWTKPTSIELDKATGADFAVFAFSPIIHPGTPSVSVLEALVNGEVVAHAERYLSGMMHLKLGDTITVRQPVEVTSFKE